MHNFENRVAVVTGAGAGIGFQIALQLASAGAGVVVNDSDKQQADAAVAAIEEQGGRAVAVVGDCSELAVIDTLIDQADAIFGRLDFAIANAGITTFGRFLDYPPEDFQRLVDINLRGSFYLAQRAARRIIAQNNTAADSQPIAGGRLLLMSSVTGIQYHPDLTAYAMSKAAIRMMAKSLGAELGQYGITVNAIAPGATLTERTMNDQNYNAVWSQITPTGRPATPGDIADTALFLLSPSASQITGQTLVVDGGWTSVSPPPLE